MGDASVGRGDCLSFVTFRSRRLSTEAQTKTGNFGGTLRREEEGGGFPKTMIFGYCPTRTQCYEITQLLNGQCSGLRV